MRLQSRARLLFILCVYLDAALLAYSFQVAAPGRFLRGVVSIPVRPSSLHRTSLCASKSSWSAEDDWSSLSSESAENAVPDTDDIYNKDLATNAARLMEGPSKAPACEVSDEEKWVLEAVDRIHNNGFISATPMEDPPLYDTAFESHVHSVSFEDEMGHEISQLVNCNQIPEHLLVAEGRALLPLTMEEKNEVSQLVQKNKDGVYESTKFFRKAVSTMFQEHARFHEDNDGGKGRYVLDAAGVARWMTKCLVLEEKEAVGPHEKRVVATLSKHASYGTGFLTEQDFQELYLTAVTANLDGTSKESSRKLKMKLASVDTVFRDIRCHDILSPVEAEREKIAEEIRNKYGASTSAEAKGNISHLDMLLDECDILDWEQSMKAESFTAQGIQSCSARKKSSHEMVELASDNKTPLRMRDGDFVFIDEESCIGCMQCVQTCPSSFVMLESGRARTFHQSSTKDVPIAVSVCPVNCMHRVSFEELKEMENARDHGDGRTDHRHLGHRRGHTPLSVAGIDSDANHRSSWYHYLKQKCHGSSNCPKKGCYDCPSYAPGENPYFKVLHKRAEKVRAKDLVASGAAEIWRKTCEL